jgi:predicted metal-dependent peptidase
MLDFLPQYVAMKMSTEKTASELRTWQPDPDLTDAQLDEMDKEVYERIITARVGLLLRHPFFGNMATRLKIQRADWLPTAAVDGRNLFYNVQFFNAMDNKEVEFVLAHEILHMVFDHLERRDDRDPRLYNISADYIVNNTLVDERIGTIPSIVNCFQDFKYRGWTSEEVYDELFEEAKKNGKEFLEQLGEMLDEHIDWEGDGDGEGKDGKGKSRPKYTKEEREQIKDEIKEAMIQAAQSAGAGNTPAGVQRLIKEITEPKMNWRELIQQQIQSTIKSDYTFSRPSRKGWHTGAILPGMNFMDTIDICVGIDMSGSIGNSQAADFLGEVKGIMEQFKDYKIKIWCFDTQVYNEDDFSADDGRDITEYEVVGGGGTDFMCNWNYMKENNIQPKRFIMFTDGYAWDSWGDPDWCETVFLIHSHHDKNLEAPFGMTAHYNEAA